MIDPASDAVSSRLGFDASHFHFAMEIYVARVEAKVFGGYSENAVEIVAGNEGLPDRTVKARTAQVHGFARERLRVAPSVQA